MRQNDGSYGIDLGIEQLDFRAEIYTMVGKYRVEYFPFFGFGGMIMRWRIARFVRKQVGAFEKEIRNVLG